MPRRCYLTIKKYTWQFVLFGLLLQQITYAQVAPYSQYLNAPLSLNPALTGGAEQFRAGLTYRSQWTNLPDPYTTYSVFADHYLSGARSGIGFQVRTDAGGNTNLRTTDVVFFYSYTLPISSKIGFKAGAQAGLGIKQVQTGQLLFNDQVTSTGNTGLASAEQTGGAGKALYPDLGMGGMFYGKSFWIGFSFFHINRPVVSLLASKYRQPVTMSIQAGYKIPFGYQINIKKLKRERFITPSLVWRREATSNYIFSGVGITYEPFTIGAWYRSTLLQSPEGTASVNSLAIAVGVRKDRVTAGYSFDIPLSGLNTLLGSTHEISIVTTLPIFKSGSRYTPYKKDQLIFPLK